MSDSDTELETGGTIDWGAIQGIEQTFGQPLSLPSLGFYVLMEAIQFGFMIAFYAILSFIPELYIITVNKYFWTKVILEVILHIMAWLFIVYHLRYYTFWKGEQRTAPGWVGGGTGTIVFIVYVLLNVLSIGYSIMYLIWGGIDTAKIPAGYQRTWQIILLVVVFLEIIGIILETIFIGFYLRRWVFWFAYRPQMVAAGQAQFLYHTAGKEIAEKFLRKTYNNNMIRTLEKMGNGGNLLPTKRKLFWKKNDVKFSREKATGTYIV